jgi:hypothetical protein
MEQVLALAPDAGSAKSGKDLAAPRKWVRLGQADGVIWGECQGSGANPYQAKVELTEPAFHCSCPSRKFPCKHALGLFLIWAGQPLALPAGEPPAWVASWLEGRAKRAEQKAAKEQAKQEKIERGEPAVDPAARQKRESARRAKVVDGLDELSRWLADLVRQGIAAVPNQPPSFWDERARRLIDAQAPGAARRVRQLADLPTTGEGWQGALLDRLARLHLLIEGHRRLDALPPEAQADLRAAVGYPVDLDEVRAGPGLRDLWRVVGQRSELEDRLRVRRTWLIGRETGRPALVLDFAHMSQQVAEVPIPPGTAIDADLAFLPGAFPLRALVKDRHGPPSPTADIGGHARIADACAAWAEAMAKDPWLETFPIVLADVVPLVRDGSWIVRDASGGVLPLSARFEGGWELLACCGGRPTTIAAEFDGATLSPLAFVSDGRFRAISWPEAEARTAASPPPEGPPEFVRAWQEATACALVGVGRKPLAIPASDGPLGRALRRLEGREPAAGLLGASALLTLYGRIGRKPVNGADPPPAPCPADDLLECGPGPAARLRRMLGGDSAALIPEWLGLLAASGRRLPDEALVDAFDLGRRQGDLRPLLRPVLGSRGRWLAAQNPADWGYVGGEAERANPESVWQTGTKAERLVALRTLRQADTEKARSLVATTWASEPADERAAIVEAFGEGLGMADEPFLEAALDDRAKTVRRAAADLLARLPESRLALRMAGRARACLRWSGKATVVAPPKACDSAMIRDGVEPKPPTGTGERAWWLRQVVAAAPLSTWSPPDFPAPDRLIVGGRADEWAEDLWAAWARAAARDRDESWADVLLRNPPKKEDQASDLTRELLNALSPGRRDALILESLRAEADPFSRASPAFRMLLEVATPMGEALAREVVRRVREVVAALDRKPRLDPHFWTFLPRLGRLVPPDLAGEVEAETFDTPDRLAYFRNYFDQFVETLRFRREMHQEFAR